VSSDGENSNGKHFAEKRQKKTSAKNTRFARWCMRETCQKAGEGRKGKSVFTECEANVEFSFAGQFEREGIDGRSRGLGRLFDDNWDGHRGKGDIDGEQQKEAVEGCSNGEASKKGHELFVFEGKLKTQNRPRRLSLYMLGRACTRGSDSEPSSSENGDRK